MGVPTIARTSAEVTESDNSVVVDVDVSGTVFKVDAYLLSEESELCAEQINAQTVTSNGRSLTIRVGEGYNPSAFATLLKYMRSKRLDATHQGNLSIIALARYLRMKKYLKLIDAPRNYAHLLVMNPKVQWFEGQEYTSLVEGKFLVTEIDCGSDKSVFTSLVDGLNWLHENGYTTVEDGMRSRLDGPGPISPYIASLVLSRREHENDYHMKGLTKRFALLSLFRSSKEGTIMVDCGGEQVETDIDGVVSSNSARTSVDCIHTYGLISTVNWLEDHGYRDQEEMLQFFCNSIRDALTAHGVVDPLLDLSLWSKYVDRSSRE